MGKPIIINTGKVVKPEDKTNSKCSKDVEELVPSMFYCKKWLLMGVTSVGLLTCSLMAVVLIVQRDHIRDLYASEDSMNDPIVGWSYIVALCSVCNLIGFLGSLYENDRLVLFYIAVTSTRFLLKLTYFLCTPQDTETSPFEVLGLVISVFVIALSFSFRSDLITLNKKRRAEREASQTLV